MKIKFLKSLKKKIKNYDHGVFPVLFLLIVLFSLYKIFEWSQLTALNSLQKKAEIEELTFIDNQQEDSELLSDITADYFINSGSYSNDELVEGFNKLVNEIEIDKKRTEEYIKIIENNYDSFAKINNLSKLLLGSNGRFIREYSKLSLKYYENELEASRNFIFEDDAVLNLLLITKDSVLLDNFGSYDWSNEEQVYQNFSEVSPIEKYTRSDFTFYSEEFMKENYDYFYELLVKQKGIFNDTYLLLKDVSVGDVESAYYKYEALIRKDSEINLDWNKLFDELLEFQKNKSVIISEINIDKLEMLYSYLDKDLGKYPILSDVSVWETRSVLCNLLWYKTNVYYSYKNEYPSHDLIVDYVDELDRVSPSMDRIQNSGDFNNIELINNEEEVRFNCSPNTDESINLSFYEKREAEAEAEN